MCYDPLRFSLSFSDLFTHTQNTKQQQQQQQQQQHNNNFHSNRALKNTGLVQVLAMPILPLKSFKFDVNPSNLPYLNFQEFHFAFSFTPPCHTNIAIKNTGLVPQKAMPPGIHFASNLPYLKVPGWWFLLLCFCSLSFGGPPPP